MKLSLLQLAVFVTLLVAAGCTSTPKPVPAGTIAPQGKTPSAKSEIPGSTRSSPARKSTLPEGEYAVLVTSDPDGGTVVVNGIPVGKAPQRIVLPGTAHGFFRDQVSLKVRFIAADATRPSETVEELLTPLDRIPATVRFTPTGASRVARK